MRRALIGVLALLIASNVRAQLTFLSDGRTVSASGSVSDMFGNPLGGYGQTNTPASPFAVFNSGAGSGYGSTSSDAGQNSALSPNGITSAGSLSFFAGTGAYGTGFEANVQAVSIFNVSFNVQQPQAYSFSAFQDIEAAGGQITFELSSANHGDLFDSTVESTYGNNYLNYSGVLDSGNYTLEAQESFSGSSFGNSYDSGTLNYDMVLSVPEPTAIGPFVGITFLGFVALKWKLAKARR